MFLLLQAGATPLWECIRTIIRVCVLFFSHNGSLGFFCQEQAPSIFLNLESVCDQLKAVVSVWPVFVYLFFQASVNCFPSVC